MNYYREKAIYWENAFHEKIHDRSDVDELMSAMRYYDLLNERGNYTNTQYHYAIWRIKLAQGVVNAYGSIVRSFADEANDYQNKYYDSLKKYVKCYNENKCGGCKEWYCKHGSAAISCGADSVAIASYASVIGSGYGIAASFVSAGNTVINVIVCNESSWGKGDTATTFNVAFTATKVDNLFKIISTVGSQSISLMEYLIGAN
jgi:hypothetical protein